MKFLKNKKSQAGILVSLFMNKFFILLIVFALLYFTGAFAVIETNPTFMVFGALLIIVYLMYKR